jgi:SsrA-binding protein
MPTKKEKPRAKPGEEVRRTVARHPRAKFLYEILETYEVGLVLLGTEVKALREGKAQLQEAFGRFRGRELYLIKCHIPEYRAGAQSNHEPTRPRKLLLHATELAKLHARVSQKGLTLVPLSLYFNDDGRAKLELALARGRKLYDKREAIRTREARVDVRRASRR